jgi:hypothetical protein
MSNVIEINPGACSQPEPPFYWSDARIGLEPLEAIAADVLARVEAPPPDLKAMSVDEIDELIAATPILEGGEFRRRVSVETTAMCWRSIRAERDPKVALELAEDAREDADASGSALAKGFAAECEQAAKRLADPRNGPDPGEGQEPPDDGAPPHGEAVPQFNTPGPSRENLLLSAWLTRKLPLRDFLLGNVFCTTSRWLIFGDTGVGKTLFALSLAAAMAAMRSFLGWEGKKRERPTRVMYLDGEMPAETFKERMQLVEAECGEDVALYGYNRDVLEPGEMPPLNTPEGEAWLMREIETVKPDVIVLDSVMSLLIGTMGEEESWAPVKLLARKITSKRIGQIWLHHTGHDKDRSFGTKTREWEMDTVVKLTTDDQAIQMEFKKARLRAPENREQFEPQTIVKDENGWRTIAAKDAETRAAASANAMTQLLLAIEADPDGTVDAWAKAADLNRSKAYRVLSGDLVKQKYVRNALGKWTLTTAGRGALKSVLGGEMAFQFAKRNEK